MLRSGKVVAAENGVLEVCFEYATTLRVISPCSGFCCSSAKTLPWLPCLQSKSCIHTESSKVLQDLNRESILKH